jgi:hypothetical protein
VDFQSRVLAQSSFAKTVKNFLHLPRDFGYIPSRKKPGFDFKPDNLPCQTMREDRRHLSTPLCAPFYYKKIAKAGSL